MNSSAGAAAQSGSATPRSLELDADVPEDVAGVSKHIKPLAPVHKDELRKAAFLLAQEARHVTRVLDQEHWELSLYDTTITDLRDAHARLEMIIEQIDTQYVPPPPKEAARGGW
jgi:hypothetical protein